MESSFKYDPEDIESLLLHKQFHELYPEEKEFVLRHLGSPEEYESLRKTLFELRDASRNDEWIEPDAKLKRELMAEFSRERRGGFFVWLNALFALPSRPWYRQTGWQVSLASVALIVGLLAFWPAPDTNSVALLKSTEPGSAPADSSTSIAPAHTATAEKPVAIAEANTQALIPPAPVAVSVYENEITDAPSESVAEETSVGSVDAGAAIGNVVHADDVSESESHKEVLTQAVQLSKTSTTSKLENLAHPAVVKPEKLSMNIAETKGLIDLLYTAK